MCGVFPDADVGAIGDQISSTYEGRHVTLLANELSHSNGLAVVTKGYPVWWGRAVGVAFKTEVAGTDLIAVDTEGIWVQDVYARDDAGNSAVVPGDLLYINTTTGLISKITNVVTQIPFGYALGSIVAGNTDTIAVKVHFDPTMLSEQDYYATFASGHGADDARKIVVTDDSGISGGMSRGLAIEYTATRAQSGTAQINGLAIDMFITAAINDWMPLTIYTGTVADKNIENFFGLSMYFEDFGNNVANFCALDIGYNSPHAPAGRNAFMRLRQHDTVQAGSAVMLLEGNSAAALFFIADVAGNCVPTNTHAIDGHTLQNLVLVEIQGNTGYIPVLADIPA